MFGVELEDPTFHVFRLYYQLGHCFMGPDAGTCDESHVKWYYDSRDGVCRQFRYGGCDGNMNRFDDRQECEDKCSRSQGLYSVSVFL